MYIKARESGLKKGCVGELEYEVGVKMGFVGGWARVLRGNAR